MNQDDSEEEDRKDLIDDDLINQFREVQYKLRFKETLNQILFDLKTEQKKQLDRYFDILFHRKLHFMFMYISITELYYSSAEKQLQKEFSISLACKKISKKLVLPIQEDIVQFMKEISKSKDKLILDQITFIFLPAYFSFYITEFQVKSLISVFREFDKETFNKYARTFFVSPFFLHFIQNALQPVISHYMLDFERGIINEDNFCKAIKNSWGKNINLLPNFYREIFLIEDDQSNLSTLSDAFFEIALKLKNNESDISLAQIYCIFDFSQNPSNAFLVFLRKYFIKDSEKNILSTLVWSFLSNSAASLFKGELLSKEDRQKFPDIFHWYLFSDYDFHILHKIIGKEGGHHEPNKHPKSKDSPKFSTMICEVYNQNSSENGENLFERTASAWENDCFQVTHALSNLLLSTDTVPKFRDFPDNFTIQNFFTDYLVNKGPIETMAKRIRLMRSIEGSCRFNDRKQMMRHLEQITDKRSDEDKTFTNVKGIVEKISYIERFTRRSVIQSQKSFDSLVHIRLIKLQINSPEEYYDSKNKGVFEKDFLNNCNIYNDSNDGHKSDFAYEIIYYRMTQKFSLKNFSVAINKDFNNKNEYKKNIDSVHFNDGENIIKGYNINDLLKAIKANSVYEERLKDLISDSFIESNPLRKILMFNKSFSLLKKLINEIISKKFNIVYEIANEPNDLFDKIKVLFIADLKPCGLKINIEYIGRFCISDQGSYQKFLKNESSINNILRNALDVISG